MRRLRIPALLDLLIVGDPALIAALADDARLDRAYVIRGPLLNRNRGRSHSRRPYP